MAIGTGTAGATRRTFGKKVSAPAAGRPASGVHPKAAAFLAAERARKDLAFAAPASAPQALMAGKPVWGRRVIAALIDTAVFIIPLVLLIAAMGPQPGLTDDQFKVIYWGGITTLLVLNICYFIGMEASRFQATLGKMAVGAIVTDKTGGKPALGRIILRNTLGKLVSGITPFYIGYFLGLAREDRRCLHDLIVGTMVCAKGKPSPSYDQTFA